MDDEENKQIELNTPKWKVNQNIEGIPAVSIKVKLVDLMYSNIDYEKETFDQRTNATGYTLPHSIIAYNPSIYSSITDTVFSRLDPSSPQLDRRKYGLWFLRVQYDKRSKPIFIEDNRYPTIEGYGKGYLINESDASIEPTEEEYFINEARAPLLTYNWSNLSGDFWASSASVSLAGQIVEDSTDVVLSGEDPNYAASMGIFNLQAFTSMRINPFPELISPGQLVQFLTGFGKDDEGRDLPNINQAQILNPFINRALLTTEVWIRCAIFADYIDAKLFNQTLNPSSTVEFDNIGIGIDLNRFVSIEDQNKNPAYDSISPTIDSLNTLEEGRLPIASFIDDNRTLNNYPKGWHNPDYDIGNLNSIKNPLNGNIYIKGRIHSPTINEIFESLKKLLSGRKPDDQSKDFYNGFSRMISISSTLKNPNDSTMDKELQFLLDNIWKSPLDRNANNWVNTPEYVELKVLPNVEFMLKKIHDDLNYYLPFEDHNNDSTIFIRDRNQLNQSLNKDYWGPRENPYSNRELEAIVIGLRYNLELLINFIALEKVNTGNFKSFQNKLGTLYQLHHKYIPFLDELFEAQSTHWVDYNDTETLLNFDFSKSEEEQGILYGDHLPQNDFNFNPLIDQTEEDIYLDSTSKWAYRNMWNRLPIIEEED